MSKITQIIIVALLVILAMAVGYAAGRISPLPKTAPAADTRQAGLSSEEAIILTAARRNGLSDEDIPLLFAIRKAENGPPGNEFGILCQRGTNLDVQAGWAAATIVKNRRRWEDAGRPGEFVEFLGGRWAPVGASNDPHNLNANWIPNVKFWTAKLQ